MELLSKIRRKCHNVLARVRGIVLFGKSNAFIFNNVQVLFPETVIGLGSFTLRPYCRLESSSNNRIILGKNVTVCSFTTIETAGGDIRFGDNIIVGEYSTFQGQGGIIIEKNVLLASHVHMISNNHSFEDVTKSIQEQGNISLPIRVKENAWIGLNVVIQAGVTIGKNSVIGSGSIVRSDIPDFCVAVGVPAKVIKKYDFDLNQWVRV